MTGDNGIYGQDQFAGIQLAIEEINEGGGIEAMGGATLSAESFDDAADPNQGASVAQQICDGTFIATFGHANSSVTLAAMPIYNRCGMPLITSYSSNPEITQLENENVFRTIVDDAVLGADMAFIAVEDLGFQRPGVLVSPDDYGDGLRQNFVPQAEELGAEIVSVEVTSPDQRDFTPQLTAMRDAGADSLVLLNTYTDAALQIKQAAEIGFDVPVIVTTGSNNAELISLAGPASEGVFVPAYFDPGSSEPAVQDFTQRFSERFDREPSEGAALAYDSVFVLRDALEAGAQDREAIISQIPELGSFELPLTGELEFNERHEPTVGEGFRQSVLLVVKDGAIVSNQE
jgi:branched-chain amino acid transport system substrate-binding protein